jgi:hypothetical protein
MRASTRDFERGGERRTAERYLCNVETTCRVIDVLDQSELDAAALNASTGGVGVVAELERPPGTCLSIELSNLTAAASHRVVAQVVYAILVPSMREQWLTGCRFRGDPLAGEDLRRYV